MHQAEHKIVGLDLCHAGIPSDYRSPDNRNQFDRHSNECYAPRPRSQRLNAPPAG